MSADLTFAQNQVPAVTGDARVDKLLSQMTLEEKLTLIHGTEEEPGIFISSGYVAGIPRLGIPSLRATDGPPGIITRHRSAAETATMGAAATFSVKDAELNGLVIGREARALGIDVTEQPFVNIDRDLEWERGYNTFGEDPYLTSRMGAAEIRGIQSQHVMAMVKHYVGYDSAAMNIWIDDQTLHEVYLEPFAAAVQAGVASIMCAYNQLNGTYACDNESTLTRILRGELGFQGFVTSDWGATHGVTFINAGLDMEMPGPPPAGSWPSFFDSQPPPSPQQSRPPRPAQGVTPVERPSNDLPEEPPSPPDRPDIGDPNANVNEKMPQALKDGTVTAAAVTRAAGHVLYEIVRFGYLDGLSTHTITAQAIEANARIIEKTSEDAAVLLKNEGGILPLRTADLERVVLIGPGARQVVAVGEYGGERSQGLPERQVGPLEAMRRITGNSKIALAVDDDFTGTTVPAAALSHDGKPGLRRANASGTAVRTDAQLDFTTQGGNALPPNSTLTWKGTLSVPRSGSYWIYLQVIGTYASISIDGRPLGATTGHDPGEILQANNNDLVPTLDGLDNVRRAIELAAGAHAIQVKTTPDTSNAPVQLRLNWYTPEKRKADHEAAIAAARNAKVAVVFLWTRGDPVFGLPGKQNELVQEVAAVNPNTIVVLNTSQPVALPWLDKVKAVLEMWWPGDEGGWATANVLLGKINPAGRLPVTWAQRLEDYAATSPDHPERSQHGANHKTTFSEGVDVGYRWFDRQKIEPLFAFGYGLSYTTFAYSGLRVEKSSDGGLQVQVTVRNSGHVDGDDVPQVYLGAPSDAPAGVQFPIRSLAAFDRVFVRAGQSRTVTLRVAPRQLQYWSTVDGKWVTASGHRTVSVGASSRDLQVEKVVYITADDAHAGH